MDFFDFSVLAFWLAFAIVVYAGLLLTAPGLARVWLCLCGAVVGGAATAVFMTMVVMLSVSVILPVDNG